MMDSNMTKYQSNLAGRGRWASCCIAYHLEMDYCGDFFGMVRVHPSTSQTML